MFGQNDLDVIQREIDRIAKTNGGALTPEMVFDEAKKIDSPLHRFYEWDVQKAALAHWMETSRRLIRAVKVIIETPEAKADVRKYVVVRHEDNKTRYTDLGVVLQNVSMASQMLLRFFYLKYRNLKHLAELSGTFNAIEREIMGLSEPEKGPEQAAEQQQ
jgi:uncharacterized protein YlbG (UPF0298 family)